MKKKQFMSKLAALTMAAAMGVTALPATTVFAQTVSIEQSDALAANGAVTKNGEAQDTTDNNSDAYKILAAVEDVTAPVNDGKNNWISAFQAQVESTPITGKTFQVTDTTFNAKTDTTGSVTLTDSDNAVWVITFTTIGKLADSADTTDQALAVALDNFFAGKTFYSYDKTTITPASVKAVLVKNAIDDTNTDLYTAANAAGVSASANIQVQSANVSSDGKTVSGRILVITTNSHSGAFYDYTASLVANEETQKNVVKTAITEVEKTSYANPISFTTGKVVADGGNSADLAKVITTALNKQLEGTGEAVNAVSGTVDKATRTSNGSFSANINGNNLSVTLKYGSAEKLDDQIKAVTKALKDQGAKDDATVFLADTGNNAKAAASALAKNYAYISNSSKQVAGVLKFNITTDFSKSVQPTTSLKAVKADDVKTAVLNAVNKAVSDAGYADDGVTYKAEVVSKFADRAGAGGNTFQPADGTQSATKGSSGKTGQYLIKVTGSIKNDYSSWNTTENTADEKTKEAVYYVVVDTNKLAEKNAESISLTDKTLAQKKEYTSSVKANGTALDVGTDVYADVYDLKAILKPEDTNDTIEWSVEPADDDTAATGARTELSDVDAHATLTKGTKVTFNAADTTKDINKTDGKLIVCKW